MRRAIVILSLVFFVSLLGVIAPVNGQTTDDLTLDPISITATLSADGSSLVVAEFRLNNLGVQDVDSIRFRVDSLDVEPIGAVAGGMPAVTTAARMDRYTEIMIDFPFSLAPNASTWIHLQFYSYDLQTYSEIGIPQSHSYADFSFYIRPLHTFGNLSFTVVLPSDATLSEESVVPLFPASTLNYTDGMSMAFEWSIPILHLGQEKVFIVKYQLPNTDPQDLVTSPLFVAFIVILGVVTGIIITSFGPKVLERARRIGQVRFVGITSEEQEVLDVLRQKGGSCAQKELYTEFSMSQSKVSLILTALEERGLVRRFRDGRENMVHLIEE